MRLGARPISSSAASLTAAPFSMVAVRISCPWTIDKEHTPVDISESEGERGIGGNRTRDRARENE
jgi:hypothetical protein